MADYSAMSDTDLMALVQPKQAPDYAKMSDADLLKTVQPSNKVTLSDLGASAWNDIKKAASNVASSVYSGVTLPRDVITGNAKLPSSGAVPGSVEFGDPNSAGTRVADMAALATPLPAAMRAGEKAIPGVARATVESKTAAPTLEQLTGTAGQQFSQAKNMGVAIHPDVMPTLGTMLEQNLQNKGILPEHAPITYETIKRFKSPPDGSVVTISDLHNARQALGNAAGNFNFPKDTLAGSEGVKLLDQFLSAIPQKAVVAGDAPAASAILKDAIGNTAAARRAGDFDARLTKAEHATDRQVAGSLDSQIRSKAGGLLDNAKASRGLNAEELAQLETVNSGKTGQNILRQLGRGGAGVIPIGAHIATAVGTGGASIPASIAIGGPLYGARKIAEALTKKEAAKLDEMLRSRSPLYESMPETTTRGLTGGEDARRAAIARLLMETAQGAQR